VLSELAAVNEGFRSDLQLEFIGVVSHDIIDSIYRSELAPYLKLKGYVSHPEAVRRQQQSQILLLVEIDSEETRGIIPVKLFEYMAAKRPILALGPKLWEAGNIIRDTHSGATFDYTNRSQLKKLILEWYGLFKKGSLNIAPQGIENYSRRALTEQLAKQL
jgi:hypothetical protein